jgi:charged multivesicular body protein 5
MRDGPGKNAIKQKAIKILQQRKQYEAQKDQLQQQSWNMEQAGMMQDNLKNTMATVDAMKTTQKELKKQYGKVDIDKIERMQDEMADLMDIGNDIQESISRSYEVPEDVDEAELDAELEALGEEVDFGAELGLLMRRHWQRARRRKLRNRRSSIICSLVSRHEYTPISLHCDSFHVQSYGLT